MPLRDEACPAISNDGDVNSDNKDSVDNNNTNNSSINNKMKDDETVSSAPPRLEIESEVETTTTNHHLTDTDCTDDNNNATNLRSSPTDTFSPAATPTSLSSNKKFVHFLNVEGDCTPIAKTDYVDDNHGDDYDDGGKASLKTVEQPDILVDSDGNEDHDDEKKEEILTQETEVVESDAPTLTPIETLSTPMEESQHTPLQNHADNLHSTSIPSTNTTTNNMSSTSPSRISYVSPPGRRNISLRLLEEVLNTVSTTNHDTTNNNAAYVLSTPFKKLNLRRFRSLSLSTVRIPEEGNGGNNKLDMTDRRQNSSNLHHNGNGSENNGGADKTDSISLVDRGIISVSWYEGTTSQEMQEHVYNCVLRKLRTGSGGSNEMKKTLEDVRLLDENVVPHQGSLDCIILFLCWIICDDIVNKLLLSSNAYYSSSLTHLANYSTTSPNKHTQK